MNNQIKVFLSSTFEDMQNEREHLVKKIFPAIKTECERRDVEFSVVDLRWGISNEQPGKIIDVCLKEIDSSRPFFIGLVGERYGTMWSRKDFNSDERVLRDRPWVEDCIKTGMSTTEIEMQYGVFDKTDDVNAFFYIKKSKWYRRKGEIRGTKEEKLLKQEKLSKLIGKIDDFAEQGKVKAERYSSTSQLGATVYQQMMEMLDKLYPVIEDDNEMARLARTQKAWMRGLCKIYYGDENVKTVESLLDGSYTLPYGTGYSGDILCKHVSISGKQGAGKSALLANLCNGKKNFFYIRACNEVSDSTRLLELLKHMVEGAGLDYANDTIFCAIDDTEKVTVDAKNFELWLRDRLPDNIRVIYSRSGYYEPKEDRCDRLTFFQENYKKFVWDYEVKDLNANEVSKFIEDILHVSAKELITRKKDHIGNNPLFHTPGMLRLLLNEMVQYGSYEHIDSFTDKYLSCKDSTEFFECFLQRLEEDYGREVIQKLMSMLTLVPISLSSEDLREYIGVSCIEWAVLNEVLSELVTHIYGLLFLDSDDLMNAVQSRYLTEDSFVSHLRMEAIKLLRMVRKRNRLKESDYADENNSRRMFILLQVNDLLLDQYIALDMKEEIRNEYCDVFTLTICCPFDSMQKLMSYASHNPDLYECIFTDKYILYLFEEEGAKAVGRFIGNLPPEAQESILNNIRSRWSIPASIKKDILENVQASGVTSIDYFNPDCNVYDLYILVENYLFRFDDESIPVIYDKVKNLLECGEIKDDTKLCMYNLIAAYCYSRCNSRLMGVCDNPYYEKALELDKTGVIVPQTLFPFIIGEKEYYEPLLEKLRKNVTLFEENTVQRINAEVHLAKAEFIDATKSSYYQDIRLSDAPDEILTTNDEWRIPVERVFAELDLTIAGFNKYDLAYQFAKLAFGDSIEWAYSFAYRFAETPDQRIFCLKKIANGIKNFNRYKNWDKKNVQLPLQVLDRVLELQHRDDAHPFDVYTTMQSKVDVYIESNSFDEAIKTADMAYSYFDRNRESFDDKTWGEYSFAKSLESIWNTQNDKFGIKHLLDKAYIHYEKQLNYHQEKERNWYIARLNMIYVIVEMFQNYGVIAEGVILDSVLSGYKEFLSELRSISEEGYNICLQNYCFLLLRAGREEEALCMVKENPQCQFFVDDIVYILHKEGNVEQCECLLSDALYMDLLKKLDTYGYSNPPHVLSRKFFDDLNIPYNPYFLLRDYKELIKGRLYFTFQMLVLYAKKNKPIEEPKYEDDLQKPKNKWDWQVARHVILLLNAMCLEDMSEQNKAYDEAMRYVVSLYKECKRKKTFSLAPIFPMLMLMSKIKLKEQHQNRPIDTIIWFKDVYARLVEETGEESVFIEWDLTFPFISLQRFLDDESSEYGGLRHLTDIMARADEDLHLDRMFIYGTMDKWNRRMEEADIDIDVFRRYAYKFIDLYKMTSFKYFGFFDTLIDVLLYDESKDELIDVVDYFVNIGECHTVSYQLSNITSAMLYWGEGEKLLTWLDAMLKDYDNLLEKNINNENFIRTPFVHISYAKIRTLNSMERYEEAYQYAMKSRKEFEYVSACIDISDRRFMSWGFYFYAGKAAMLSEQLHEAMDFFKKDSEIINNIQDNINNPESNSGYYSKPEEALYTQDEIDAYKIDNGCMMATCMLKQGNIEDGKRHFAEHVEPLLSDADADNHNVKLYQEELAKLSR